MSILPKQLRYPSILRLCVVPLILLYMLFYLLELFFYLRYGGKIFETENPFVICRTCTLCAFSLLYGIGHIVGFHPACNKHYRQFLSIAPWTSEKVLFLGPVHLDLVDFVLLAILVLLGYLNNPALYLLPLAFFSVGYLACFVLTLFATGQSKIAILALFLAPLSVYPFKDINVAIAIFVGLYFLCYIGLRLFLKEFPWNTHYWNANQPKELLRNALNQGVIGWPHKILNDIGSSPKIGFASAFIISFLLTWWLHIIRWLMNEPYPSVLLVMFGFIVAFLRFAIYTDSYSPPISLMGRIHTFKFIIPGYDKIYAAPLLIILAVFFIPRLFGYLGLNDTMNFELLFFLILFLAFVLPPKLKDWQLTGSHRIARTMRSKQRQPSRPDPVDQYIKELFSIKSGSSAR